MKVKIKDLANTLGTSPSTVSRALNDSPGVGQELREKIAKTARDMGYMPDQGARNLVKRTTGNIGLYVPRGLFFVMNNPFFAQVMQGISDVIDDMGYNYILSTSQLQHRKMFRTNLVDGIIMFALRLGDPYIRELEKGDLPSVIVGSYNPSVQLASVRPDDYMGMYEAVNHLINRGHKKIALINGPLSSFKSVACLDAYRRSLLEGHLDEGYEMELNGEFVPEWGFEAASTLFDGEVLPSAIACANDLIALGVYRAAHDKGLRIPEDVSVVGFGDFPLAEYMSPGLTTIHTPLREMGYEAARMLIRKMKGGTGAEYKSLFEVGLVVRESIADLR